MKRDFIVVEGPIGVGKTTLARKLAESYGSELLLEGADENPFLEQFYQAPEQAAFQTQLFFLFQRAKQLQEIRQADLFQPVRVADFIMEKDRLFAQVTLSNEEYKLYEQVYAHVTIDAPIPDLVIYLQAPVDVLQKRVNKRDRNYEKQLSMKYLERLVDKYTDFFYNYTESPLLIVNAAEINFAENDEDYNLLLEQINRVSSGRHYFNPSPALAL
ncbi:MAG: deoxynucleoside kinase [Thiohalomonadales bacterium]